MPSCSRCTRSRKLPASCRLPSGDEEGARLRSARIAYMAVISLSLNYLDVNACGYLRYLGWCTSVGASMSLKIEGILESWLYVSELGRSLASKFLLSIGKNHTNQPKCMIRKRIYFLQT